MTTVHAQTGIKLATKPAKTSLLGGHFIYKANTSTSGLTVPSANIVENVSDDPTTWGHNVHIGSNGIKLRVGETTLSEWVNKSNQSSLIFYQPQYSSGTTTLYKGIELNSTNGLILYKKGSNNKGLQVTPTGIEIYGGQQSNEVTASFGDMIVLGAIKNEETRTVIYNEGFRFIRRNSDGSDTIIANFKTKDATYGTNPIFTFGSRQVPTQNYSSSQTYNVGDICIYNQVYYICKEKITTAESFDSSKWKYIEGEESFALGYKIIASGQNSVAVGNQTKAIGTASHAEGSNTIAAGAFSHTEGAYSKAFGAYSHAEGNGTLASDNYAHAEGNNTIASNSAAHAEGFQTQANGRYSHAEGYLTITDTNADGAHAEGRETQAIGSFSHAEGYKTIAYGNYSHAEGCQTIALGNYSHAAGYNTYAGGQYQTVFGKYNDTSDTSSYFVIGNGTSDSNRSNLFAVDSYGDLRVTIGSGTNFNIGNKNDIRNYLSLGASNLEFWTSDSTTYPASSFGASISRIGRQNANHILLNSAGMKVYGGSETNANKMLDISSSGMNVYKNGTLVAQFGDTVNLNSSYGNLLISSTGINLTTNGTGTETFTFNNQPLLIMKGVTYTLPKALAAAGTDSIWKIRQALPTSITNSYTVLGIVGYDFNNTTSVSAGISTMNVYECGLPLSYSGTRINFSARNTSGSTIAKGKISVVIYLLVSPKVSSYTPVGIDVGDSDLIGDSNE